MMHLMGLPHDFEIMDQEFFSSNSKRQTTINMIAQNVPVNTAKDFADQVKLFCQGKLEMSNSEFLKQDNTTRTCINTFPLIKNKLPTFLSSKKVLQKYRNMQVNKGSFGKRRAVWTTNANKKSYRKSNDERAQQHINIRNTLADITSYSKKRQEMYSRLNLSSIPLSHSPQKRRPVNPLSFVRTLNNTKQQKQINDYNANQPFSTQKKKGTSPNKPRKKNSRCGHCE